MMNTKTLAIGQDVYVASNGGYYFCQGKVTKITPKGVQVLAARLGLPANHLSESNYDSDLQCWVSIRVKPDGTKEKETFYYQQAADEVSRFGDDLLPTDELTRVGYDFAERFAVVPIQFDNEGNNGSDGMEGWDVHGFEPWHIDDMPFAERRAWAEQKSQVIPFKNAGSMTCLG